MSPAIGHNDCEIARRCSLVLGAELERGAIVREDLFFVPLWNARGTSRRQTCRVSLRGLMGNVLNLQRFG